MFVQLNSSGLRDPAQTKRFTSGTCYVPVYHCQDEGKVIALLRGGSPHWCFHRLINDDFEKLVKKKSLFLLLNDEFEQWVSFRNRPLKINILISC